MGQYYYAVILNASGKLVAWMDACVYNEGMKLMEHAYLNSAFVNTFESLLIPGGAYYKSRVVWAGDYAEKENGQDMNLHELCDETTRIHPAVESAAKYRFLVNHTKKQYVDKSRLNSLHPLPLLTAEGNGRGGGEQPLRLGAAGLPHP